MRRFLFAILFALALIPACTKNKALPEGWRAPTNDELKAPWRSDSKDRYTIVNGDFNADGIADQARLLVREDEKGFGLFASISQPDGTAKALLLDETNEKSLLPYIGIKKAEPGKYTTACGKGYGPPCKKDEPEHIEIKTESIDFFITESANAIIYWDSEKKDFRKVWVSD